MSIDSNQETISIDITEAGLYEAEIEFTYMDYTLTSKVYADISDCALEDLKILPQQQNFNYQIGSGELYYTVP